MAWHLSNTVARCSLESQRSSAGAPSSPIWSRSTFPAKRLPNLVIIRSPPYSSNRSSPAPGGCKPTLSAGAGPRCHISHAVQCLDIVPQDLLLGPLAHVCMRLKAPERVADVGGLLVGVVCGDGDHQVTLKGGADRFLHVSLLDHTTCGRTSTAKRSMACSRPSGDG